VDIIQVAVKHVRAEHTVSRYIFDYLTKKISENC